MNTVMNKDTQQRNLSTADLAAAGAPRTMPADEHDHVADAVSETGDREVRREDDELAQLFPPDVAREFRSRWDAVQIGFVDDPGKAVREADELVAQVMKSLADSFANARAGFENEMNESGNTSTESLRVALRGYRSFFQRLLSL
ncbi:MAG TPA: hypothetical protein VGE16_05170 [Albitalea sp.]